MYRHIVVTGGCGFIGSNFIIEWMKRYPQDKITNIDCNTYAGINLLERPTEIPNLQWEEHYNRYKADISDWETFEHVNDHDPVDMIFHFAAETHVDRSIERSEDFIRTNVMGTRNVLEFARWKKIDKVFLMSTDEVYGPAEDGQSFQEWSRLLPSSPYAASKASSDMIAGAYRTTYNMPIQIIRSTNVYGPRQHQEKFIPLFIRKAIVGKKMPLYGDGKQQRTWLYIDDCVDAIIKISEFGGSWPIWHISCDEEKYNIDVAEEICKRCGCSRDLIESVTDRPAHDRRYCIDYKNTLSRINWEPTTSFQEGVLRTIVWFTTNYDQDIEWTPGFMGGNT